MTTIYTTKTDYINQQVLPALPPEMHYLAGEIASHMLIWHEEVDENGNVRVDKSGFTVDQDADFWASVEIAEDAFNSEEATF